MDQNLKKLVNGLSPNERKILPHIKEKDINKICKKSNLDKISVLRALEYLQVKKVIKLSTKKKKIIEIGVNGALYRKKGLPERRLLHLLNEKRIIPLQKAEKESKLTSDEFKASLGALKKKAMIELRNGKIVLSANKEEISKKSPEEAFLELKFHIENAVKAISEVKSEYYGNHQEIFNLLKNGIEGGKFNKFIKKNVTSHIDFWTIISFVKKIAVII